MGPLTYLRVVGMKWALDIPESGGYVVGPGPQAVSPPEVAGEPGRVVDVEGGLVKLAVATGIVRVHRDYCILNLVFKSIIKD